MTSRWRAVSAPICQPGRGATMMQRSTTRRVRDFHEQNWSDRTMTRFRTFVVALCLAAFTLSGCETVDSVAHDPDKAKTRRGAGYGAAAGAVVGLLTAGS